MDGAVRQVIEQSNHNAFTGQSGFGAEVGSLMLVGVESYFVDYRLRTVTYYMPDDETCTLTMVVPAQPISRLFDQPALIAAIRSARSGAVKYPEFVARSMAAGCVGYLVWLVGQHVSYLGRKGVAYVDPFLGSD
ncbi:uncharacterized protein YbcV (DUF1398 family) [Silvimonas terrae]|uniref:Uncharacterized protein YbcV (DUF1398 family) n=1 Tax=Silvimonas terrae TaxID=300266 RepID=A0A840RH25_9NEIS|nr:DUF1398 domain-containing protein [Silvimonas terrae]MBB5192929.1 uncharacterized protein YbcV (DUF1398 family) [Silvimonas terrae]